MNLVLTTVMCFTKVKYPPPRPFTLLLQPRPTSLKWWWDATTNQLHLPPLCFLQFGCKQRQAWNVSKCEGPQEGRRKKEMRMTILPIFSFPPLCTNLRELSGNEVAIVQYYSSRLICPRAWPSRKDYCIIVQFQIRNYRWIQTLMTHSYRVSLDVK